MRLTIILASTSRTTDMRRARATYLRESPVGAEIIVTSGRDLEHAWERGLRFVGEVDWIHFGADCLEPHPGWWKAARADGERIAAPVLWRPDGTPSVELRDWAPASESLYPTMTWKQLERFGPPPFRPRETSPEFVVRTQYAFTLLG